jgi:LysW-gamma-L-lysine carboxypeptidase
MDTVPGFIPVQIENNRLYGRGAADAKASLAAMIVASHMLAEQRLTNRIIVAGVVGEERTSKGIKNLIKHGYPSDYTIFGEPSGVENITIGYKGGLNLKIRVATQTGHSAAPWLFENAIEKAFDVWMELKKLHLPQEKLESRFYSTTSCLIKITGGRAASMVPSDCAFNVDFRIPPQLSPQQVYEEVVKKIKHYETANPKVTVRMKIKDRADPFEVEKDSPLVRALSWSIRKVRHKPATLLRKTGTGDMNMLGKTVKTPIVTYGPGQASLGHTPHENIDVKEYQDSILVYQEALPKLVEIYRKLEQANCNS